MLGGTRQEVKCITEDNISDYSIEDIVLPLPGHDVIYPINRVGIFLLDLLKKDGLSPEKLQNHVKQVLDKASMYIKAYLDVQQAHPQFEPYFCKFHLTDIHFLIS